MSDQDSAKYRAISRIIRSPDKPAEAESYLSQALLAAMDALGVRAASIAIFDGKGGELLLVQEGDESLLRHLGNLEKRMLAALRDEFKVESLYTTLNDDGAKSLFSYLIKIGEAKLGTISGICEGSRNIALEHDFIEVMALALRQLFGHGRELQQVREQTVKQVAATLGDRINNPLQAVLLAVQLLQQGGKTTEKEVEKYLKKIEESSLEISRVLRKLMNLAETRSVTYLNGTQMIDLGESDDREEDSEKS